VSSNGAIPPPSRNHRRAVESFTLAAFAAAAVDAPAQTTARQNARSLLRVIATGPPLAQGVATTT
jgi:hypothetical protein